MNVPKLIVQGLKLAASLPSLVLFVFAGQFCMVELFDRIPGLVLGKEFDPSSIQTVEGMNSFVEAFQARLLLTGEVNWPLVLKIMGILLLVFIILTVVRTVILGTMGSIFLKGASIRLLASVKETFPALFPRLAAVGLLHVIATLVLGAISLAGLKLGGVMSGGGADASAGVGGAVAPMIQFVAASITLMAIAGAIIVELLRLSIMGHAAVFRGLGLAKVFRLGFYFVVRSFGRLMQVGLFFLGIWIMVIFFTAFMFAPLIGSGEFGMALAGTVMTMVQAFLVVAGWGVISVLVRLAPGGAGILEMLNGMRSASRLPDVEQGLSDTVQAPSAFISLPENVFRLSDVINKESRAPLTQTVPSMGESSDDNAHNPSDS